MRPKYFCTVFSFSTVTIWHWCCSAKSENNTSSLVKSPAGWRPRWVYSKWPEQCLATTSFGGTVGSISSTFSGSNSATLQTCTSTTCTGCTANTVTSGACASGFGGSAIFSWTPPSSGSGSCFHEDTVISYKGDQLSLSELEKHSECAIPHVVSAIGSIVTANCGGQPKVLPACQRDGSRACGSASTTWDSKERVGHESGSRSRTGG